MDKGALTMDAMYRICTEFTMPDGEVLTVRTLSDAEVQTKNRLALEASRELLNELRDKSSSKFQELIAPLYNLDRDQKIAALVTIRQRELQRESVAEFPFQIIPIPEGASLAESQEVLNSRESGETEIRLKREAWVNTQSEKYAQKINGLNDESLSEELVGKTVLSYTYADYIEHTQYATLLMSCRRGDGSRFFDSIEGIRSTGTKVLDRLFAAYRSVDSVDPWELAKNV